MKIGIISINMYSKGLNFACPIHTYAFQQFLLQNNIDNTVIDYKPIYYGSFDLRHPYDSYKVAYDALVDKKKQFEEEGKAVDGVVMELDRIRNLRDDYEKIYELREERYDKFQNFIDSNYIKTEEKYNPLVLEGRDPGFDCYICVTDVIWGTNKADGFDWGFFLNCASMNNKYKIAYSASRGVFQGYTEEQKKTFLNMIGQINEVSVREDALKEWINENSDIPVTTVLDPVLLHERSFWEKIAVEPEEKDYVLLYYVMEKSKDTIRNATEYAKKYGLKIVELSDKPFNQNITEVEHIPVYAIGPEEWLGYILHAKCIFTNSFHACCFSVLFEKTIYVGFRHGDKVGQLLTICGLADRRMTEERSFEDMPETIDYEPVRKKLAEKRDISKKFILKAIENAKKYDGKASEQTYNKEKVFAMRYYAEAVDGKLGWNWNEDKGIIKRISKTEVEYIPNKRMINKERNYFGKNRYFIEGYRFAGWRLKVYLAKLNVYCKTDGTFDSKENMGDDFERLTRIFKEGEAIPKIKFNHFGTLMAEAVWVKDETVKKRKVLGSLTDDNLKSEKIKKLLGTKDLSENIKKLSYKIYYRSGKGNSEKYGEIINGFEAENGKIKVFPNGTIEYQSEKIITNGEENYFEKNKFERTNGEFVGWRMRLKIGQAWCYYLSDGTLGMKGEYGDGFETFIKIFEDEDRIPILPVENVDAVVLEPVWITKSSHTDVSCVVKNLKNEIHQKEEQIDKLLEYIKMQN